MGVVIDFKRKSSDDEIREVVADTLCGSDTVIAFGIGEDGTISVVATEALLNDYKELLYILEILKQRTLQELFGSDDVIVER